MKTKNEKQNEVFNTGKWRNTMKRRKKKPGSTQFRGAELFRLAFPEFAAVLAARAQESRPMGIQPAGGEVEGSLDQLESKTSIPPPAPTGKEIDRMNAITRYLRAVTSCPPSGTGERLVHRWVLATANLARAANIEAADWARDVLQNAVRVVNGNELREAWAKAGGKGGVEKGARTRPPEITPAPLSAAEFIERGAGATEADLMAASPVRIDWGNDRRLSACALLRALFLPGELVYCGYEDGGTVLQRDDWISRFMDYEFKPPLICVNPLKPGGGITVDGKPSMRCDDAVAVFRHAVAEMDSMPLDDQFRFWKGFGLETVSAITYSGGKSLHVLPRVDALDRAEWDRKIKGDLFHRCLIPLGCDSACVNPSRLTRLAGACRPDRDGAVQRLLFIREGLK